MRKKNKDEKTFNVRMKKDVWLFLKRHSLDKEIPMNTIILNCIEKIRKSYEKKVDTE